MGIPSLIHVIGACTRTSLKGIRLSQTHLGLITTQQILVRRYLANPIFRTDKLFFFRESLCITYILSTKWYMQDRKFKYETKYKNDQSRKRDETQAKRCEYKIYNG